MATKNDDDEKRREVSEGLLIDKPNTSRGSGKKDLAHSPFLTGECPTMNKVAFGRLEVFLDFKQANKYLENANQGSSKILVTTEIDWSWTRILEHFEGVITNQGTRVSRAAEVITLMKKPGVLGTKRATEILRSGTQAHIVCDGNVALVYLVDKGSRRAPLSSPQWASKNCTIMRECMRRF